MTDTVIEEHHHRIGEPNATGFVYQKGSGSERLKHRSGLPPELQHRIQRSKIVDGELSGLGSLLFGRLGVVAHVRDHLRRIDLSQGHLYFGAVKLNVQFDEYEAALLKKARRDLTAIAKRKGEKPPTLKDVVRGSVRMGVHAVYGEDYVSDDLLDGTQYAELIDKDLSQIGDD